MTYELFQQGPNVYVPVLLLSAIITVFAYGAFPFIFAKTRNKPITKKKYNRICYGVNFAVMFVFILINGGAVNGVPYILWTSVFSGYGTKILRTRGILIDNKPLDLENTPGSVTMCKYCEYMSQESFKFCPKCGKSSIMYIYDDPIDEEVKEDNHKEVIVGVNTVNEPKQEFQKPNKPVNKKLVVCLTVIPILILIIALLVIFLLIPGLKYNNAKKLLENGKYELAYSEFLALGDFSNSKDMLLECRYAQAVKYRDVGDYELANKIFESLGNYRDSKILIHKHDYRVISRTEATCTEDGNEVFECSGCKDSYTNYLKASHKYVVTKTTDATCTATGSKSYECSSCHNTYSEIISQKSHSYSSATCTKARTCSTCGKTEGIALGHTTGGVKCTRCGEVTFKTLTYSGTGSKVISCSFPNGKFRITVTMTSGTASVDVKVYYTGVYGNDTYEWFLITDKGESEANYISGYATSGSIVINASSNYSGDSGWKVTIEAVAN